MLEWPTKSLGRSPLQELEVFLNNRKTWNLKKNKNISSEVNYETTGENQASGQLFRQVSSWPIITITEQYIKVFKRPGSVNVVLQTAL